MLLLDVENIDYISTKMLEKMKYHETTNDEEKLRIGMVKELIEVKHKRFHLGNFSVIEIDQMLEYLCTA